MATRMVSRGHAALSTTDTQAFVLQNNKVRVSLRPSGAFTICDRFNNLQFTGKLSAVPKMLRIHAGSDAIGSYHEIEATLDDGKRMESIRLYEHFSSALLLDKHIEEGPNVNVFPSFEIGPDELMHVSYRDSKFSPIQFGKLDSQGPWLFFDKSYNTLVVSPADNFLVSSLTAAQDGQMASGIDAGVSTLPAGFTHGTLVTFGRSINHTLDLWGSELLKLGHKQPVANDADVVLNQLGYWTDKGASYYYSFDPKMGYEGTLLAVRDEYRRLGVPLAYMQLDSWWYPKQKRSGKIRKDGALVYQADQTIFPAGLEAFQGKLGIPLVTHARWIADTSPYRQQYRMSGNAIIDTTFWKSLGAYLKAAGDAVYEQDWLDQMSHPAMNIGQAHQFLEAMADGMRQAGIGIQYCRPTPSYFMASTKLANVRTIRTSTDRFEQSHYDSFLYGTALAHAVGLWSWSDVMMSNELPNLALATLSGGPVGVGDALGTIDVANLKRVMRSDSVLLKPDTPLMPIDFMYLADAEKREGTATPMIAMAQTRFGNASEYYVVSYPRSGKESELTVPLHKLGIYKSVYAWNWRKGYGQIIPAGGSLTMRYDNDWDYQVLVPLTNTSIALIGDANKIVPLARKRFISVKDDGSTTATISFAAGEKSITLTGYAAHFPHLKMLTGSVSRIRYSVQSHLFTCEVSSGPRKIARIRIL